MLTRVRDCQNRLWLVRTFVGTGIEALLGEFCGLAAKLVARVDADGTGFKDSDMNKNARGPHWFSIFGHDRNNKKVSSQISIQSCDVLTLTLLASADPGT